MSTIALKDDALHLPSLQKLFYTKGLISDQQTELAVAQFSNGYSNLTYLITTPHKEFVLRRPPKGAIKRGHDMGREFKVLSQLSQHFEKAPRPYFYETDASLLGAPFYVMEKVAGVVINYKEALKRKLKPHDFSVIAETWLDTFVAFHQLDYKAVGLEDLGRPEGYVERQVTNWGKQYYKAKTREIPAADFVIKWLSENQPKTYEHTLIHNDYKYDNIVLEENNWGQINAILDWEMCTLGDPLMDLGTSLGYWVMENDGPLFAQTIPSPTMLPGNPSRSDIVQTYSEKSGKPINNLIFYYAFGLFKIAVIVQQIYYRYNKGLTTNPKFAQLDEVAVFLCLTANQAIEKNRIEKLY